MPNCSNALAYPARGDCKDFHVKIQDFTQLLRDFFRGDHRTKLDGALP